MVKWSWTSVFVGAATTAAAAVYVRPRDPVFEVISIDLTSFKLSLPVLDAEMILTVQVSNPNIVPIHYSSTTMKIFYDGSLLGQAQVEAGSQEARSCQILRLPARLSGLEMAHHASKLLSDLVKREMVLDASVEICGTAKVVWWDHSFKVYVASRVVVDPVFLDVIDQDNKSEMELFVS